MNKNSRKSHYLYFFIVIILLIGIILGVFSSLIATATAKNEVKEKMDTVLQYLKRQTVSYKEYASEEATSSLFEVSNKAFAITGIIDYESENISARLKNLAEINSLNGIIIANNDQENTVLAKYVDDDQKALWDSVLAVYGSITKEKFKIYADRRGVGKYYYDYAMVARGDDNGVLLCYKRRLISKVVESRFSISTLLTDFVFITDGVIVVTDGNVVTASNNSNVLLDQPVKKTAVVSDFPSGTIDNLVKIESNGVYYGIKTKCLDSYLYVYTPESTVFFKRTGIVLSVYAIYLFIIIIIVIMGIIVANVRRKEQKEIEIIHGKEKEKLAEQAIRANEAKTEFLRRMSHDLRTPINGIRGMVKMGDYYHDDAEKQRDCRKKIWVASEYLLELVNDVLYMNKLSVREPEWKEEEFSLSELLSNVDYYIGFQAKEAGIEYVTSTDNFEHDYLFGGKTQLKRVILNLIDNAIKYNKENGSIFVSAKEIDFKDGIASYQFVCRDNGIGISKEFATKMFDPFERENNQASEKLEGVGLGLSIVKKMITKGGWDLSCESKKGEGTTFTLTALFKVAEQPRVNTINSTKDSAERLKDKTILIAEDNDLNFEIVDFILKKAGARVIRAKDGAQAVEIFEKSKISEINVILMDVMMPKVDGHTATRIIRKTAREDCSKIPVVAMSAIAFADDIQKSKDAGMNAHVTKPIDTAKLIGLICQLLDENGGEK